MFTLSIICLVVSIASMLYIARIASFNVKSVRYLYDTIKKIEGDDDLMVEYNELKHVDIPFAFNTKEISLTAMRTFGFVIMINTLFVVSAYLDHHSIVQQLFSAAATSFAIIIIPFLRVRSREVHEACHSYDVLLAALEYEQEHLKDNPNNDVD